MKNEAISVFFKEGHLMNFYVDFIIAGEATLSTPKVVVTSLCNHCWNQHQKKASNSLRGHMIKMQIFKGKSSGVSGVLPLVRDHSLLMTWGWGYWMGELIFEQKI